MNKWVLLFGCLLATASQAQSTTTRREVWEWKDANGVTHYSDAPAPGARKIVIIGSSTATVPPNVPPPGARPAPGDATQAVKYASLEIWQPTNEASYFGADAVVDVRLRSTPRLAQGDRLLSYLDGKLTGTENAYEFSITSVERGVHSLTSVIIDSKGNEKIRSAPVVFYVKQQPISNPANKGPALKPPPPPPPPKPTPKSGG